MKITIRDLPVAERLSPRFMDALEVFLPKWLDSLLLLQGGQETEC